jgi:hypothetical protein
MASTSTFFDTLKRSFDNVKTDAANDNAISTSEFLEATESLTTLFGMDQANPVDHSDFPMC